MKFSQLLIPSLFVFFLLILVCIQNDQHNTRKQRKFHSVSRKKKLPPLPSYPINPINNENSNNNGVLLFDVMKFGAAGNGVTDDTEAFKKAWNVACQAKKPALLLVPDGHSFMIKTTTFGGPCKSSIQFQIDGTIVPPDGPLQWSSNDSEKWIVFYKVNGMSIQGKGLIDGRGKKWWDLSCKEMNEGMNCDSPAAIRLLESSGLIMRGLTVKNSPKFHIIIDKCQDVHVEMVRIESPIDSPNTDGIHIENSKNIKVYDSIVATGDDCISIGPDSRNLDIKNMICGPSHGISIGSLGKDKSPACVSNISVTDSIIKYSENGVRIKTWQGGLGSVNRVTFKNIKMENVQNPIIINQYYCLKKKCLNQTSAVMISDIIFGNISGTYNSKKPLLHIACSDSIPCTDIKLSKIKLVPAEGKREANPFCWEAFGTMETLSTTPVRCLLDGFPKKKLVDRVCVDSIL